MYCTWTLLIILLQLGEQIEPRTQKPKRHHPRLKKKKAERGRTPICNGLHISEKRQFALVSPATRRRAPSAPSLHVESSTPIEVLHSIPTPPSWWRHFRCACDGREPVFAQSRGSSPPPPGGLLHRCRRHTLSYNLHLSFLDHTLRLKALHGDAAMRLQ